MSSSERRMSFNKGYTPEGYAERVFHIHVHAVGDNDEILFRDYLRDHPAVAREYEALNVYRPRGCLGSTIVIIHIQVLGSFGTTGHLRQHASPEAINVG